MFRKTSTRFVTLAGAGLLVLGTAVPMLGSADTDTPATAATAPGSHHGWHHGRHGRFGGPFMHELRSLGLSDAQKQAIHADVRASMQQMRGEFTSLRALHHAFETAAPGSAGYDTVVSQLADAEAKFATDRVQQTAALRTKIFGELTDAQKSALASKLASLPEPPAHH